MKVLILSLAYLPFVGGAELAVKEITDRISDVSFDLITVNLDGRQKSQEKIGNINVYRLGRGKIAKYFFPFSASKKAEELHRQNHYDIVWVIMANQAGLAALRFKKVFPQIKYLLTLQEGDSLKSIWLKTWLIRPWYKAIYRQADCIQAISNYLKKRAEKYGYQGPVVLVPNGVSANFFNRVSLEAKLALKQKIGLKETDKILITASRLVRKNGLDILIKSIKDQEAQLIILGTGRQETKLKALAQELGLRNKILFLGHINHPQLPAYLQMADIFIRPSRSEGLGTAFLEAMASGLPVIATKVGGIPDFLADGQTGLFCERNNPRDLREKIDLLFRDPARRNKIIKNSESLVAANYKWESIAQNLKNIFISLKI